MTVGVTHGTSAGAGGGGGGQAPLPPDTAERKKAVKRYFARTPSEGDRRSAERMVWAAGVALVVAASLAVVGMFVLAGLVAAGAVVAAVNGWIQRAEYRRRFDRAEPKPGYAQMDATLRADLRRIADQAMKRFRLGPGQLVLRSNDVPPVGPHGPRWLADQGWGPIVVFGPARKATGRSDVDRLWRFTAYDVLVACATAHHLAIHLCTLDVATGSLRDEHTHDYHYAHLVAILMNSRPGVESGLDLLGSPLRARSAEQLALREFQIAVASNDRSTIVVGVSDEDRPDHRIRLQESNIYNIVDVLRHLLRERATGQGGQ